MADVYNTSLSEILHRLESIYSIDKLDPKNNLEMFALKNKLQEKIKGMSKEEAASLNKKAGEEIVLLSYISSKLKYYGYVKLSYHQYPALDVVIPTLIKFTKIDSVNRESFKELKSIIVLLNEIDKTQIALRKHLAYRYMRLFLVLVLHKNLHGAAVIADLILNQMVVR